MIYINTTLVSFQRGVCKSTENDSRLFIIKKTIRIQKWILKGKKQAIT